MSPTHRADYYIHLKKKPARRLFAIYITFAYPVPVFLRHHITYYFIARRREKTVQCFTNK